MKGDATVVPLLDKVSQRTTYSREEYDILGGQGDSQFQITSWIGIRTLWNSMGPVKSVVVTVAVVTTVMLVSLIAINFNANPSSASTGTSSLQKGRLGQSPGDNVPNDNNNPGPLPAPEPPSPKPADTRPDVPQESSVGTASPATIGDVTEVNMDEQPNPTVVSKNSVITISSGQLQANVLKSRDGRDYYAYYKVPYAASPTGRNRFKPAEPVQNWEGIRFEEQVAPQCIQKVKYSAIDEAAGEEDCLYLNVYTPKLPENPESETGRMPTLFYIHGGGYDGGNGSRYGAAYLMDEDVVFVTVEYRLGPFGFLNSMDGRFEANLGLKDQTLALTWVRDNIKYFGGDPNRVMLFGNSGGGTFVSLHMLSPMSKGLFHSAISESQVAVCTSGSMKQTKPEESVKALAKAFNCSTRSTRRMQRCLRDVPAADLAIYRSDDVEYGASPEYIEDPNDLSNVFMPDFSLPLLKSGKVNRVPWIVGMTSMEYFSTALKILGNPQLVEQLNANWTQVSPTVFDYESFAIDGDDMSLRIKDFYFGDNPIGNDSATSLLNLVNDRLVLHCCTLAGMLQSKFSDVYLYYMTKHVPKPYHQELLDGYPKDFFPLEAGHADELQLIFPYEGFPKIPKGSEYYEFSKMMVKIWTQFAATGKSYSPTGENWPPITSDGDPSWFQLDDVPKMTQVILPRMEFWNQFSPAELHYK